WTARSRWPRSRRWSRARQWPTAGGERRAAAPNVRVPPRGDGRHGQGGSMNVGAPQPPLTPVAQVHDVLARDGHGGVARGALAALCQVQLTDLLAWRAHWNDLPSDRYLRDGGHYRQRRHSCFVVRDAAVTQAPHRPHWQSIDYNALHGGIERHFE